MTNGNDQVTMEVREVPAHASVQPRFREKVGTSDAFTVFYFSQAHDQMPEWGNQPLRDESLREFMHQSGNDIIQGAQASIVKKMNGLNWKIEGPEALAEEWRIKLLRWSEMGKGWLSLLSKGTLDYTGQDKGLFWEIVRETRDIESPIVCLAHLDSAKCRPTNDPEYPVIYIDKKGKKHKLHDSQVIHIVDQPSPSEDSTSNLGFCAVSRILKSAKIIQMLGQYKDEKLSSRPVPGIVLAQGLTGVQIRDALAEAAEQDLQEQGRLIFRGFPILASLGADVETSLDFVEFRSIPDTMNIVDETELFINAVALAFGVDTREFWPQTLTGATKADALVQDQKAKGKGPGELINQIEFQINTKVIPSSCSFYFDYQDDEEDRLRTEIRKEKSEAVRELWEPNPVTMEGIITTEEARNLLVELGVLPEELRVAPAAVIVEPDVEAEHRGKEGEYDWWYGGWAQVRDWLDRLDQQDH